MKTTILLLGCFLTFMLSAAEPATFAIRLVLDSASPDSEELTCKHWRGDGSKAVEERLHVQKKPLLDRSAIKSAAVQKEPLSGDTEVRVTLTERGAKRFAEVTGDHVGRRLAIVVDGKVYSAPRVNSQISGGKFSISGSLSEQEATQLAARLSDAATK